MSSLTTSALRSMVIGCQGTGRWGCRAKQTHVTGPYSSTSRAANALLLHGFPPQTNLIAFLTKAEALPAYWKCGCKKKRLWNLTHLQFVTKSRWKKIIEWDRSGAESGVKKWPNLCSISGHLQHRSFRRKIGKGTMIRYQYIRKQRRH